MQAENSAAYQMYVTTGDKGWIEENDFECLILEHQMAAIRLGFSDFFLPLYSISKYKTNILDGTLSEIRLFSEKIIPLVEAKKENNKFKIAEIIKKYSPLLKQSVENKEDTIITIDNINKANEAVKEFLMLWDNDKDPNCIQVLKLLKKTELFDIPDIIQQALVLSDEDFEKNSETNEQIEMIKAWYQSLQVRFSQVQNYIKYITGKTKFNTHQGVKGLEFPRVMAIMDDESARGSWFKYEKLFGLKEGSESSVLNVKRLFYVICSRAKESLALIAYTNDPKTLKSFLINRKLFTDNEIII